MELGRLKAALGTMKNGPREFIVYIRNVWFPKNNQKHRNCFQIIFACHVPSDNHSPDLPWFLRLALHLHPLGEVDQRRIGRVRGPNQIHEHLVHLGQRKTLKLLEAATTFLKDSWTINKILGRNTTNRKDHKSIQIPLRALSQEVVPNCS